MNRSTVTFLLLVLTLLAPRAVAQSDQQLSISAELSKSRAFVGDEVIYQLVVRGSDTDKEPEVRFPESVNAEYRGASRQSFTSTRIINGRQQITQENRITHQYQLTVREPGTLVIPPATVRSRGATARSNDVRLDVVYPQQSTADVIEIELPDRPVYVGESIPLDVTWWIDAQTRDFSFDSSAIPGSFRVSPVEISAPVSQRVEFSFMGQRAVALADERRRNGVNTTRLRFRLLLTPTTPGRFEIGPLRCAFTRIGDFGRGTRMYAESGRTTLEVREIPSAGQPDGFTGLIGSYGLTAGVSNSSVNVGDPIELVLRVNGPAPLLGISDAVGVTTLTDAGFRVSPDGWSRSRTDDSNTAELSITVRASSERIGAVPPLTISAFDPATGEFSVFASEPVPIDVNAVQQVTLDDAVVAPGRAGTGSSASREILSKNDGVFWGTPGAQDILDAPARAPIESRLESPVWITYLGTCAAAPCLAWGIAAARRRRDPFVVGLRKAQRHALHQIRRGDHAAAARTVLSAALHADPRVITSTDVSRVQVEPEHKRAIRGVLLADESKGLNAPSEHPLDAAAIRSVVNAAKQGVTA